MTWSIDTDDFEGICNGPKFPLLRTLNHALHNRWSFMFIQNISFYALSVLRPSIYLSLRPLFHQLSPPTTPPLSILTTTIINTILTTTMITTIKTSRTMAAVRKKYEIASQQIKETATPPKRQPGHMRSFAATHLSNSTQARSPQLYFAVENLPRSTNKKSSCFSGSRGSTRRLLRSSQEPQSASLSSPFSPSSSAICLGTS